MSKPRPANAHLTTKLDTLAESRRTFLADFNGAKRSLIRAARFECTLRLRTPATSPIAKDDSTLPLPLPPTPAAASTPRPANARLTTELDTLAEARRKFLANSNSTKHSLEADRIAAEPESWI
ncbi:hypothetical protein ACQY0O_003231 [Thecaphora frezii]